jgi:hypothetical protein
VVRSWVKVVSRSVVVAVIAAAAQLGIAQALGIVRWAENYQSGVDGSWSALLTWVVFIYALSVLGGAAVGRRAGRRPGRAEGVSAKIIAGLAAALGATAAISLVMVQAGNAVPPVNVHPELVVSVIAAGGVVVGLVLALLSMFVAPIEGAVRAWVASIWLAAIGSAVAGIVTQRKVAAPRLALVDVAGLADQPWWPGVYLMVVAAGALGFVVAIVARWGGAHRFTVAVSGVAGPAIAAAAYAIAGTDFDNSAFVASLYAVAAGLLAASLVALPRRDKRAGTAGPEEPTSDDERYRPGNYLAGSRADDDATASPFRVPSSPDEPAEVPHPAWATMQPEPARTGAHRAGSGYGAVPNYLDRELTDQPIDEYPAGIDPAASMMGQPPQTYDDGRSEWLRTLGDASAHRRPGF